MSHKHLLTFGFIVLSFSLSAQRKQKTTIKTSAECEMCKRALEEKVKAIKGVKKVEVDYMSKEAKVVFKTRKTNIDSIRQTMLNMGYDADGQKATKKTGIIHTPKKKD